MDEPLFGYRTQKAQFGEQTQKAQVLEYIIGGLVTIFIFFSITVAVVFGSQRQQHFAPAAALLFNFIVLVVLVIINTEN